MHHDMPWNEFSITTPGLPVLTQNGLNKYLQGYQTPTSDHRMTRNTCQVCLSLCSTFCFSSISSQNNAKHLILELLGGSSREMRNLTARKQNIFNVTFTHYFRSELHSSPEWPFAHAQLRPVMAKYVYDCWQVASHMPSLFRAYLNVIFNSSCCSHIDCFYQRSSWRLTLLVPGPLPSPSFLTVGKCSSSAPGLCPTNGGNPTRHARVRS